MGNVDVIGLSGLITPSLDEMVTVAKELSKAGFKHPLLIGGATTSKMHTAVKIAPNYFNDEHPVIHVLDASRSVTVVSSLLNQNKTDFVQDLQEEYDEMREDYYAGLEDRNFLTFEEAKNQKKVIDFDALPPAPVPNKLGITVIDSVKIADVISYIDWNPFFQTWELRGRYPNRGYPKIFDDAERMLKEIVSDGSMWLK